MNTKDNFIYTWEEAVNSLIGEKKDIPENLSSLLSLTKIFGLGKSITRQKHAYSADDLEKLKKILEVWVCVNSIYNLSASDKKSVVSFQNQIIKSVLLGKKINFFSIFCPSYKTDGDRIGYNSKIGKNTTESIDRVLELIIQLNKLKLDFVFDIYFSDLLLENLDSIKEKCNYEEQLELNYYSFNSYVLGKIGDLKNIFIYKLSHIIQCKEEIGKRGLEKECDLNNPIHKRIFERNKIFYETTFKWDDQEVVDRTKIIIGSYEKLAQIFNKYYDESVLLWTESLIERGLIYEKSEFFIAVLYPKQKDRLVSFFESHEVSIDVIKKYDHELETFINDLYLKEPVIIFEQNPFHVWAYLGFEYKMFKLKSDYFRSILLFKKNSIILFTPHLDENKSLFFNLLVDLKQKFPTFNIKIQNVSESWLNQNNVNLKNYTVKERSKKEVVYSIEKLVGLEGKSFSKLRNLRNKLNKNNLIQFKTSEGVDPILLDDFVDRWSSAQGYKYTKNKSQKEKYVYREALQLSKKNCGIDFHLGFKDNILISVCLILDNKSDCVVSYTIKGINSAAYGGIKNASDSTYLFAFKRCLEKGKKYMNDGDVGVEVGSINHKNKFQPEIFYKSFDVILQENV